jgi:hypothetical protein
MKSEPITPRGLHTHGKEFLAAAEVVYGSNKQLVLPLAFLWGRAIELLLKSYLLSVGVSVQRLKSRKFGHDLVALHKEAIRLSINAVIGSEPGSPGLMRILNLDYRTKRLEYRESGTTYDVPDAELVHVVAKRLVKGVDFHLKRNGI